MRNVRFIVLLALAAALILSMSCSGNSVTQPTVTPERLVSGNGPGGGDGGNGPNGPSGPDILVDCVRIFDAEYIFTFPSGLELEAMGELRILDADCAADESDVRVKFLVDFEDETMRDFQFAMLGTKTLTDDGLLYTGEWSRTRGGKAHSFEVTNEYELLVYETETPDGEIVTVIEGTFHRNRVDTWDLPNSDEFVKQRVWNAEISGTEVS